MYVCVREKERKRKRRENKKETARKENRFAVFFHHTSNTRPLAKASEKMNQKVNVRETTMRICHKHVCGVALHTHWTVNTREGRENEKNERMKRIFSLFLVLCVCVCVNVGTTTVISFWLKGFCISMWARKE